MERKGVFKSVLNYGGELVLAGLTLLALIKLMKESRGKNPEDIMEEIYAKYAISEPPLNDREINQALHGVRGDLHKPPSVRDILRSIKH